MAELVGYNPIKVSAQSAGTKENPFSDTRNRKWELAVGMLVPNKNFALRKSYSLVVNSKTENTVKVQTNDYSESFEIVQAIRSAIGENRKVTGHISSISRSSSKEVTILGAGFVPGAGVTDVQITVSEGTSGISIGSSLIEFTVSTMAKDWNITLANSDEMQPVSLRKRYIGQVTSMIGDYFAQELYIPYGKYDGNIKYFETEIDISKMYFPPLSNMRIGCVYNVRFEDASGFAVSAVGKIQLYVGTGSDSKVQDLNVNDYGDTYTVINSGSMPVPSGTDKLKVGLSFVNNSGTARAVRFWLDNIWVEYDYGLSLGGAITIDDYPIRQNLGYTDLDDIDMIRLATGDYFLSSKYIAPSASSKWLIESEFKTLTSVYNYFKYMELACREGHLINLHPKLPEMPEVVTGKIVVKDLAKQNFSFNRTNFKVLFYEV